MATSRNMLLEAINEASDENLKEILKQQVSKERQVDLTEVFDELSRNERQKLCHKLATVVENESISLLESLPGCSSDVLVGTAAALYSITIAQNKNGSTDDLLPVVRLLHRDIISFPSTFNVLKNRISQLCELWYRNNLNGKESVCVNAIVYLLKRSTSFSNPSKTDVRRVWAMKSCLSLIDLNDEQILNLFKCCATSSLYLNCVDGRKLIGYLLCLNADCVVMFHRNIKTKLGTCSSSEASHYGDIYLRAWLLTTDTEIRQKLEFDCIQDFIHHAVYASSSKLFNVLHKLLGYMNSQKNQKQVGEMLFRLYSPILWRSLKVANSVVRANAAALFFSAFPLEDPTLKAVEVDVEIERQLHLIEDLLYDPCPDVRSLTIKGLCHICDMYWEMIPAAVIKGLLMHLVEDLAFDAASVKVRISVFQGFSTLIENPMSHPFLKAVLPKVAKCFHDIAEPVRIAFLEMLRKLKGLKTIKFWDILPVEEFLERLAVDKPTVCRRIVSLVFTGYHPLNKGDEHLLEQSIDLIETNRAASRAFYLHAHHFLDLNNTVNYMLLVCQFLTKYTKMELMRAVAAGEMDELYKDPSEQSYGDDSDDEECNVSMLEFPPDLISGLLDAVCILWVQIRPALNTDQGKLYRKKLVTRYSRAMSKFYKVFKDSEVAPSLVYLSSFLPPSQVSMSISYCMSQLRSLSPDCTLDDYATLLESLCNWGRGSEVIEMIIEWLNAELHKDHNLSAISKKKNGKYVRFRDPVEPHPTLALKLLSFMLQEPSCRQLLIMSERTTMMELLNQLHEVQRVLELQLSGDDCHSNEDFTRNAFAVMCKLVLLLHDENATPPLNGIQFMFRILEWIDSRVMPKLQSAIDENCNESQGRSILVRKKRSSDKRRTANQMLALRVIEDSICVSRYSIMSGVIDVNLAASIANFCGSVLRTAIPFQGENGCNLLREVICCVQQLQEYGLIDSEANKVIYEATVPSLLSSVLRSMESYLEKHFEGKTKLASFVKPPVLQVLKHYEDYTSKECGALKNVIAAMMASVLSDVAKNVEKGNLSMEIVTDLKVMPPFSYVLISIVISTASLTRRFVRELIGCIKSQVIEDPFGFFAFLSLFSLFHSCKVPNKDLIEGILCLEDNVCAARKETPSEKFETVLLLISSLKNSVGITT